VIAPVRFLDVLISYMIICHPPVAQLVGAPCLTSNGSPDRVPAAPPSLFTFVPSFIPLFVLSTKAAHRGLKFGSRAFSRDCKTFRELNIKICHIIICRPSLSHNCKTLSVLNIKIHHINLHIAGHILGQN